VIKYIKARCGERSTFWGVVGSLALIVGSFFVPYEYSDVANTMRGIAMPLFVGMFLMEDKA
jgi:hypothetical protein